MTGHLVFVYGSLKSGFHNHRLLIDHKAESLGMARTLERHMLLKGNAFPFLLKRPAHARVSGELYRVDDAGLVALDRLESHPRFYRRELTRTVTGMGKDGTIQIAWVYFLQRDVSDMISAIAAPDANGVTEWTRDDVAPRDVDVDMEA